MNNLSATPEELLAVVQEMFPTQYDRALAELTIRKQDELILQLTKENDSLKGGVEDRAVANHQGHVHEDGSTH